MESEKAHDKVYGILRGTRQSVWNPMRRATKCEVLQEVHEKTFRNIKSGPVPPLMTLGILDLKIGDFTIKNFRAHVVWRLWLYNLRRIPLGA